MEVIHYNKKIQEDFDINLNNYKSLTGKYIEYKTIGKEYSSDDQLIYEGEYLEGKRHGNGKEYDENGILKYEGEYLKGERSGKGKEYDEIGELKFEGEYLYGKKRIGKIYYRGQLEFEGEYFFDRKYNGKGYDENGNIIYELIYGNGKVIEYDINWEYIYERKYKLKFVGEYLNGERNGKGKEFYYNGYSDKLVFEGEYSHGQKLKEKNIIGIIY